jgi:hypothetical protein
VKVDGVPQWKTHRYDWQRPYYGPPHNLELVRGQMFNSDLKAWLGLPPKLPPLYSGMHWVGNVRVFVESGESNLVKGRRKHRVMAECPRCKRWVPAGRLHQHMGEMRIGRGRVARRCEEMP